MRKNIVYIFSIILLGLSLTQCTDNLENEKDVHGHETVFVQLTVANASTRTISSEETTGLSATWEIGDKLYVVAPTGGSLGYLTAKETGTSALFEGHISAWSGTQNLQLYYLGKGATIANGATSFSYDISSQNGTLAYVATKQLMHGSLSSFDSGTTTFTGTITLQNLFSVAKFDFATNLDETATLTCGLSYSTASLNLATGALTPTDGQIALGTNLSNASAYYMVLIPGTSRLRFSDGTTAKTMYKYIDADRFYCADASRASVVVDGVGDGETRGLFTVSNGTDGTRGTSDDVKVRFSMGNLYCDNRDAANPKFYFEDKQYNYRTIGGVSGAHCLLNETSGSYSGTENSGFWGYFAESTTHADSHWGMDTYTSNQAQHKCPFKDWGENPIINGGNTANQWRTLSKDEMQYLKSNGKMKRVKSLTLSNGSTTIAGLLIYPDDFSGTMIGDNTTLTWSSWMQLESLGVVFLPVAGDYSGTGFTHQGTIGYYHSSTIVNLGSNDQGNYRLSFGPNSGSDYEIAVNYYNCFTKRCVRLVKDAN